MSTLEEAVEIAGYPRRVKPIFFVIEASQSTQESLIAAVNNAMHIAIPTLIDFDRTNSDAAIQLGVLSYNNDCYWMYPQLEYIDTFQWQDLSARDDANLENALCELEKQLSRNAMLSSSTGCYAPIIIYIGHNYPSFEILKSSIEKLNHNNWYKDASKFVFTTNRNACLEMLEALIGCKEAIFFTPKSEELSISINAAIMLSSSNYGELSGSIPFPQEKENPTISIAHAIRKYLCEIPRKTTDLLDSEGPYKVAELSGLDCGFILPNQVRNSYGREKCKLLKTIRKAIADANNIPYEITECTSKGHCNGACPMCDQEAQDLSQQLTNLIAAGQPVVVPSAETTLLDGYLPAKVPADPWLEW